MTLNFYDKTGELRSNKELQEAIVALKNAFVLTKLDPIMVHYPAIWDGLNELLTRRRQKTIYKHLLQNLLAVIHRDGGHYTDKHGIEKSVEDAIAIIANFNANIIEDGDKLSYFDNDLVCPRCALNIGKYSIEEPYKCKCPRCGHSWRWQS